MSNSPPPPYSENDSYPTKGAPPYPEANTGPIPTPPQNNVQYPQAQMNADINHTRVIQLPPIVIQTPLFGAFPVETDCRYCNVSFSLIGLSLITY